MIKNIARWFFGLVFLLMAASFLTTEFIVALSGLLLVALLIPPLEKALFSKIEFPIPNWSKFVLGVFLFGVMVSNTPKTNTTNVVLNTQSPKQEQTLAETISPTPEVLAEATTQAKQDSKSVYSVVKVIDGDTVQVNVDGKTQTIRLIGVDTPEIVDPRKPVQCFASEASKKAKELLTGKKVSLEADPTQGDKDKYNRQLRYIFLEDGTNFNKLMIAEGYGHEYTYDKPYKYMEEFKQTETKAREAKRGLWADGACLVVTKTTVSTANPTTAITTITSANSGGGFSCAGKKTCGQMVSCAEAKYYLDNCGVSKLDGDKDGIPCEALCN